mmetsp:Transcript_14219/g.21013  ORF Transcript_14219/g.21013 Transcript_14219/m.21013 type:complete len:133 (-) Transcript_14219:126-524(-)
MNSLNKLSDEEKLEFKPCKLSGDKHFMYGSNESPKTILDDITKPSEDGQSHFYAFAMEDYPEVHDISRLWLDSTFKYIYTLQFDKGRIVYTKDGKDPQEAEETKFNKPIQQKQILCVYTRLGGIFHFCNLTS